MKLTHSEEKNDEHESEIDYVILTGENTKLTLKRTRNEMKFHI